MTDHSRRYPIILADPPWHEITWSHKGKGRSASAHYDTMTLDAIKALPIADLSARHGWLILWTTWPMLRHAMDVADAWGYTYSSDAFLWIKSTKGKTKDGSGLRAGGGHTTRKCSEMSILARRGKGVPRKSKAIKDVIIAPRREPHRKPDEQYTRIEAVYDGPYLELFARYRWPGWNYAYSPQLDTGPAPRRWKSNSYPSFEQILSVKGQDSE
jgi:N6-adenosine-specific RNA methylase IME4